MSTAEIRSGHPTRGGGHLRAGPRLGFTTAEPWLPVVADAERLCVESQQEDPASTLAFVRSILRLRSRNARCSLGRSA